MIISYSYTDTMTLLGTDACEFDGVMDLCEDDSVDDEGNQGQAAHQTSSIAPQVGAATGGLIGLAAVAGLLFFLYRRRCVLHTIVVSEMSNIKQ